MRKLFQKDWFDIEFKSFANLDPFNMPDNSFYDKFYEILFTKYTSYTNLPKDWKDEKELIKDFLISLLEDKKTVLSIGCGIGYIEYLLSKEGIKVVGIEPSKKATQFLKDTSNIRILNGYFPEVLNSNNLDEFEIVYMCNIDYVFKNKEFLDLLSSIRRYNPKRFLIFTTAIYKYYHPCERLKDFAKMLLCYSGILKKSKLGQFWGYMRKPNELLESFKKSGFKIYNHGFINNKIFWIEGRTK